MTSENNRDAADFLPNTAHLVGRKQTKEFRDSAGMFMFVNICSCVLVHLLFVVFGKRLLVYVCTCLQQGVGVIYSVDIMNYSSGRR